MIKKSNLLLAPMTAIFLLMTGCGKTNKHGDEVYRILHDRQIVQLDSTGPGSTRYQIRAGRNTVFSYNKISSVTKKDTIINRSESIIFQIPPDVSHFDYTESDLDSSDAFYMATVPKLVQFPISGGRIKGHKLNENKWQIEMSVTVHTGSATISRHIKHDFSVSPYGNDSLPKRRKTRVAQ